MSWPTRSVLIQKRCPECGAVPPSQQSGESLTMWVESEDGRGYTKGQLRLFDLAPFTKKDECERNGW